MRIVFNRTCLVNWLALSLELSLGRPATESCYVLPATTDLIGLRQVRNSHPPCSDNSPYSVIRAPGKGWCYQFCPGNDYLADPARHIQTKPCWQPSYWSLSCHTPPVTLRIIPFLSDHLFRWHESTSLTQLSHRTQF